MTNIGLKEGKIPMHLSSFSHVLCSKLRTICDFSLEFDVICCILYLTVSIGFCLGIKCRIRNIWIDEDSFILLSHNVCPYDDIVFIGFRFVYFLFI